MDGIFRHTSQVCGEWFYASTLAEIGVPGFRFHDLPERETVNWRGCGGLMTWLESAQTVARMWRDNRTFGVFRPSLRPIRSSPNYAPVFSRCETLTQQPDINPTNPT